MIKVDLRELKAVFQEWDSFFEHNAFSSVESVFTPQLQNFLDRGKNAKGEVFPIPYSDRWGKKRKAAGLQTSRRDLKFTGAMRGSIGLRGIQKKSAWITVSEEQTAKALANITGNLGTATIPPSDFFQVNSEMELQAGKRLEQEFKQYIGK